MKDHLHDEIQESIYKQLELSMVKYADLLSVPVSENFQPLIPLVAGSFKAEYHPGNTHMVDELGEAIYVREGVQDLLEIAQSNLAESLPDHILRVTYGYRSLNVQRKWFEETLLKVRQENPRMSQPELLEEVHRYIAVPEVSGHPTGGAVDVIIEDPAGNSLDFGSAIYDFDTKDSYTDSPFVSSKAKHNRQILRNLMMQQGFAPFDGEWWHFSYGDREWAFYYGQEAAIYDQQDINPPIKEGLKAIKPILTQSSSKSLSYEY